MLGSGRYDLTRWTKNEDILSRGNKTKQGRKMWKNMAHVKKRQQLSEKARRCLGDSGGMQGRADLKGSVHRARKWVGNCRKWQATTRMAKGILEIELLSLELKDLWIQVSQKSWQTSLFLLL